MFPNKQRDFLRRQGLRPAAERLEGRLALSTLATTATPVVAVPTPADVATTTSTTTDTATTTATSTGSQTSTNPAQVQVVSEQKTSAVAPSVLVTTMLTRGDQVVGFLIRFSKPMDSKAVQDLRNYHAYQITQPNKYLARLTYQSDKPKTSSLGIHSATYIPADHSVVILLSGTKKATGQFRVEVSNPAAKGPMRTRLGIPDLVDESGNPLSGPTTTSGRTLSIPIMLRPANRIQLDKLSPGKLPV